MEFEEWWGKAETRYKIPKTAFFCDFGKTVAEIAYEIGFQEGRKLTKKSSGQERVGDIWTNEDESAEIERQIIDDARR